MNYKNRIYSSLKKAEKVSGEKGQDLKIKDLQLCHMCDEPKNIAQVKCDSCGKSSCYEHSKGHKVCEKC